MHDRSPAPFAGGGENDGGAQLVYTGAASCGGVTDDGCDTFLEFERRSGRYFRFQRRPMSPPLAAARELLLLVARASARRTDGFGVGGGAASTYWA